jgi:hypothetical protein
VLPPEVWRGSYLYERHHDAVVTRYPLGPVVVALPAVLAAEVLGIDLRGRVAAGRSFAAWESTLASMVVAATTVVLFLVARRRLGRTVPAAALAVVFAFGTSAWSTASRALWQHGPVMLLFSLALLALVDAPGGPRRVESDAADATGTARPPVSTPRLIAAGACLGAAVWCRPVGVVALVVFAVGAVLRYRRRGLWLAGSGLVPIALLAVVGAVAFGDPNPMRYPQTPRFTLDVVARGLAASLVSPSRGLLVFTPVVLVAGAAVVIGVRRRTFGDLETGALVAALALVGAAACNPVWWGGYAYGPRLLTDLLPFVLVVCLPLAACWPTTVHDLTPARVGALAIVGVLAAWGMLVHARGALVEETWSWNSNPVSIDADPDRAWDWSHPQFLAGSSLTGTPAAPPHSEPSGGTR